MNQVYLMLCKLMSMITDLGESLNEQPLKGEAKCMLLDGQPALLTPVITIVDGAVVGDTQWLDENTMTFVTGVVTENLDPCTCLALTDCPDCGCEASILLDAFDYDRGLLTPGDTSTFEIFLDGVSQANIVHDYTTSSDGVNVSSFYTPVVAAINAVAGWSMAVDTDVAVADQGKPTWLMEFSGTGPSELRIVKGADILTINVDAACAITGTSDDGGTGAPFGTDPFSVAP